MSNARAESSQRDMECPLIFDHALAARLERTEAIANSRFVEARQRTQASSEAAWIEVAGARAMFDGVDSPCTQTFGLGVLGEPTRDDLATLESFFQVRGAPVYHEIAPLISPDLIGVLNERGYVPIEFTNVLCRRIGHPMNLPASSNTQLTVKPALPSEANRWARTAASGWSESPELQQFILALARNYAETEGCTTFVAQLEDKNIATGVVAIAEGVALLAGASTIPEARKRGAQSALLAQRLRFAVDEGCDLAMMCALPGSPSQRNAQRNGFQIAYTRTKWQLCSERTVVNSLA